MRLFVAVPLDTEVTRQIDEYRRALEAVAPQLRWQPRDGWHITLKFLGATHPERLPQIVDALRTLRAERFPARLSGTGFFVRAGVFYIAVQPSPALVSLAAAVDRSMTPSGFKPETVEYHPHITLARTRNTAILRRLQDTLIHRPEPDFGSFPAHEFCLYESFTRPEGVHYEVREQFSLDQ